VAIRPWRVSPVVDTGKEDEVRAAIENLTDLWGGYFVPILDSCEPIAGIRELAGVFDVDNLYAESPEGDLADLLRVPGYMFHGRAEYGPFSRDREFRKGPLRAAAMSEDGKNASSRMPRVPSQNLLLMDAYLGRVPSEHQSSDDTPIDKTKVRLRTLTSYVDPLPLGLVVVRRGNSRDVVSYWNFRSLGGTVLPLDAEPSEFNKEMFETLSRDGVPTPPAPEPQALPHEAELEVWGAEDLTPAGRQQLEAWAASATVRITEMPRDEALRGAWFTGFEAVAKSSFRVETRQGALSAMIPIPTFTLPSGPSRFQGVIGAEIQIREASDLDPRLTVSYPPYRRHAGLLNGVLGGSAEHFRTSSVGPVLAVQPGTDEVALPLAYNLEVMRLMFDDPAIKTSQSDEGKFQSRAAEMFGGPMSGVLTQPGIRAGIERLSERGGLTLQELQNYIELKRGDWPDPIRAYQTSARDYAIRETNRLLGSGFLVPLLDVQCTYCRVVSKVNPSDLAAVVRCEFCQEDFPLALALALSKPKWLYRFAAHLAPEKVKAMLPAVATLSVLATFNRQGSAPLAHVLGLEVTLPDHRPIEVDVATILDDSWTLVLAEVKNRNQIDLNDVENLFALQRRILDTMSTCIVALSTLKDEFSADEVATIREVISRDPTWVTIHRQRVPLVPLLLTGPDLSRPWMHDEHPWRWQSPGSGKGIFGAAFESLKRHAGLLEVKGNPPRFIWDS
jgi:hypothetical protein